MFRTIGVFALAGIAVSIAPPAFSQESSRHEVSVQALGSFVTSNTWDGVRHEATNSGGVLGTYRFFFTEHHGVEANYAYSRNTLSYSGLAGFASARSNNHEISGAYVFRYPFRRWQPFALAGAAALIFVPVELPSLKSQTKAAFVYGGGADFNLSRMFYVRAQYRGFVYNSPTYDLATIGGLAIVDRTTHRAEPSLGLGVRF